MDALCGLRVRLVKAGYEVIPCIGKRPAPAGWTTISVRRSVAIASQFQNARQCGARTRSGKPCRSPATKKGRCRLHGGASGSGGPSGERNGQYTRGKWTKGAIAERRKFSGLLKMLRAVL
jgi:glucans biosynthesis protein